MKPITIKALNYVTEHASVMFLEQIAMRLDETPERIRYIGKKYGIKLHTVRGDIVVKKLHGKRYYFVKRRNRFTGLGTYMFEYFTGSKLKKCENVRFIDGNPLNCRLDNLEKYSLTEVGQQHRFKVGQVPFNKGTKGLMKRNKTSFKRRHVPHNAKPNETVSVRKDSSGTVYQYIKMAKRKWVLYHRHLWEQVNGPIPIGHIVVFRDKNTMNCELSNLELITRAEHVRRNDNREKASETMKANWAHVRKLESVGVTPTNLKLKTKRKAKETPKVAAQVDAEQLKIAGGYFNRY